MVDSVKSGQSSAPGESSPIRTVVSNRIDFSASLESFQGPLDLLLYLIKENEIEITEIPISHILEQYLKFLDHADQWDLQLAGEFLVMAATLMEIKSRDLLPVAPQAPDGEEIIEDPRSELVRQLLQYRKLKEQASALEKLQDRWRQYRPRGMFNDFPDMIAGDTTEVDRATARDALLDVDLYGLFAAYDNILKAVMAQAPRAIVYDGESIEEKIARIDRILKVRPFAKFVELVAGAANRANIAATFVALLELVRRRAVRLHQLNEYGDLEIKSRQEGETDAADREEAAAAEATAEAAIQAKAALDAQAAVEGGQKLPWTRRQAKPKFEGLLRPEDVEELDAEETEIGRRIDAILAAADVISERFERSREGRERGDESVTMPAMPPAPAPAPAPEPESAPVPEPAPTPSDSVAETSAAPEASTEPPPPEAPPV